MTSPHIMCAPAPNGDASQPDACKLHQIKAYNKRFFRRGWPGDNTLLAFIFLFNTSADSVADTGYVTFTCVHVSVIQGFAPCPGNIGQAGECFVAFRLC